MACIMVSSFLLTYYLPVVSGTYGSFQGVRHATQGQAPATVFRSSALPFGPGSNTLETQVPDALVAARYRCRSHFVPVSYRARVVL
jgi:hypothetical protein